MTSECSKVATVLGKHPKPNAMEPDTNISSSKFENILEIVTITKLRPKSYPPIHCCGWVAKSRAEAQDRLRIEGGASKKSTRPAALAGAATSGTAKQAGGLCTPAAID